MTDTYSLINLAREGDKTAEKKLVDDNLLLVHSCARKLMHPDYEYEDLVQVGSIGLVKAIRRFDTSLGLRLSTYAVPLIMGEIKRY
ncbi:MAG: sigma-70 family RNA polymerase sigma factor, partial [Clostridia bacterium]|nr:sigma-70 family RNA polymerase sigma factor [Clostridia bacterium]